MPSRHFSKLPGTNIQPGGRSPPPHSDTDGVRGLWDLGPSPGRAMLLGPARPSGAPEQTCQAAGPCPHTPGLVPGSGDGAAPAAGSQLHKGSCGLTNK